DLPALGVGPDDRVSPVAPTELARAFSAAALALGNRRTGLYVKPDSELREVVLVAHPPTAVVVGSQLAQTRSTAELRFLLGRSFPGRARGGPRPNCVRAVAPAPAAPAPLWAAVWRAPPPRHARQARDEEAARWKRALPYKVARRLAELFAESGDTQFSSARWR